MTVSGPLDETGTTANTDAGDVARSWFASIENVSAAKAFRVFALCSATSDATIAATTDVQDTPFGTTKGPACPAGRRVLGGGVGTTADPVASAVQVSSPSDLPGGTGSANITTGDVVRAWQASIFNNRLGFPLAPATRTYKIFALCAADELGTDGPGTGGGTDPGAGGGTDPGASGGTGPTPGPSGPTVTCAGAPRSSPKPAASPTAPHARTSSSAPGDGTS